MAETHRALERDLRQIEAWGILLRDPATGLINFLHQRGRTVFLCWKLREGRGSRVSSQVVVVRCARPLLPAGRASLPPGAASTRRCGRGPRQSAAGLRPGSGRRALRRVKFKSELASTCCAAPTESCVGPKSAKRRLGLVNCRADNYKKMPARRAKSTTRRSPARRMILLGP